MWMPKVSYWTQPAGESHITSAKGKENIAFIEIDKGPYLVRPSKQAFDIGERPYNIHASNIVWKKKRKSDVQKARLWKNSEGKVTGSLLKFQEDLKLKGDTVRLVVIEGAIQSPKSKEDSLAPGSVVSFSGRKKLRLSCLDESGCILYLKSNNRFKVR